MISLKQVLATVSAIPDAVPRLQASGTCQFLTQTHAELVEARLVSSARPSTKLRTRSNVLG
jgi:hypothetical protein